MENMMATTPIQLYQRLDAQHKHNLIPVKRSRNGSPIAGPHATTFYLRFREDGKRRCVPAGADVLEADNLRKSLEARGTSAAYIERTKNGKKPRTHVAYRDSVNLFVATCKKVYLDELTRADLLAFKTMLAGRYGGQTVYGQWNNVMTSLNDCGIGREVDGDDWIQKKDRPVNIARRNKNGKYETYTEGEVAAMLAVADPRERALVLFLAGTGFRIGEAMHATNDRPHCLTRRLTDLRNELHIWLCNERSGHGGDPGFCRIPSSNVSLRVKIKWHFTI
jgi:hypothetical protein